MKKLEKFDVVFSYHVIEHLKIQINLFLMQELLKDDGILF